VSRKEANTGTSTSKTSWFACTSQARWVHQTLTELCATTADFRVTSANAPLIRTSQSSLLAPTRPSSTSSRTTCARPWACQMPMLMPTRSWTANPMAEGILAHSFKVTVLLNYSWEVLAVKNSTSASLNFKNSFRMSCFLRTRQHGKHHVLIPLLRKSNAVAVNWSESQSESESQSLCQ
jgi:hypothetical protein